MIILFIAQATAPPTPWWVGAITGTAGTVVVLAIAVKTLWAKLEESRKELSSVTKESIEVITKILQRQEQSDQLGEDIRRTLDNLINKVKDDDKWKHEVHTKLDTLLTKVRHVRHDA